jgi:WD40-like Beta Propeller Repeat
MREGLNDEQIAERLGIDVATAQYDVWGILSKLGLESRAQIAVARPQTAAAPEPEPEPEPKAAEPEPIAFDPEPEPQPEPTAAEPEPGPLKPEPVPFDPEPEAVAPSAPESRRRWINLRLAAQFLGVVFALAGVGLIVLGVLRMTDDSESPVTVRTVLPTQATPGATEPAATPVPAVVPEGPGASGQTVIEIFTVSANGDERTLLVPGSFPRWSPDGEAIAFAAGNGDLFLMTPDGGPVTALPATISLSDSPPPPDAGCHARPFQWSPSGGRLAVCNARSGNIDVIRLSGDGNIFVGSGSSFSWSPDGALIAFTGYEGEGAAARAVIYIADPAQPNAPPQPLAEGTTPDWSPDGEKIAYVANDGLHVAAVDTGESTLVAAGEIARTHVSWSPDSTHFAYVSAGRIHIATLNSDAPTIIGEGLGPQWSPDGAQIVYYTSGPNGNDDLWSVAAGDPTASPRRLGKGRSPAWSPDSTHLAYDRFIP